MQSVVVRPYTLHTQSIKLSNLQWRSVEVSAHDDASRCLQLPTSYRPKSSLYWTGDRRSPHGSIGMIKSQITWVIWGSNRRNWNLIVPSNITVIKIHTRSILTCDCNWSNRQRHTNWTTEWMIMIITHNSIVFEWAYTRVQYRAIFLICDLIERSNA